MDNNTLGGSPYLSDSVYMYLCLQAHRLDLEIGIQEWGGDEIWNARKYYFTRQVL